MKIEPNNIYLGDAYKLIKDIPDKSVDLVYTDPPYEIEGLSNKPHGIFSKNGHTRKYEQEMLETGLGNGMDYAILDDFMRVMKKPNIYIWCNKAMILPLLKYFVGEKKLNFEIIILNKTNVPPFTSGHYLKDKEYCLYFWGKGVKLKPTFETGKTVYVTKVNIQDRKDYGHPTIKPLSIIETLINNSVGGGLNLKDIVILDPFLGSGTTALAAKHLGMSYIGFEINENYYKIAKDRLNGINQKGEMSLFDTDFDKVEQLKLDL